MTYNWRLFNGKFVINNKILAGELWIRDGVIETFLPTTDIESVAGKDGEKDEIAITPEDEGEYTPFDCQGGIIGPGFIDLHVHGGGGGDVMDGSVHSFEKIGHTHGMNGTTRFLLTTVTADHQNLLQVCQKVKSWMEKLHGEQIQHEDHKSLHNDKNIDTVMEEAEYIGALPLGIHLEGPYINPSKKGAQNEKHIRPFSLTEFQEYQEASSNNIKMITLAPEMLVDMSSIRTLTKNDIVVSIGHTEASYEQLGEAYQLGATHVTHLYNAMPGIHHRSPGPITFALNQDGMTVEFIADGHHVHPAIIQLALRAKRSDEIIIVTDGISAVGMPDGRLSLGGLQVEVQDGVAKLEDGTLAGSCLTMEKAYHFLYHHLSWKMNDSDAGNNESVKAPVGVDGVPPEVQLFQMMSSTPARIVGVDDKLGSIDAGKLADLVLIKNDQVLHVMVEGRWIKGGVV